MKKEKKRFICDRCGHEEPKWAGRCPACSAWNSFSEIAETPSAGKKSRDGGIFKKPVSIEEMAGLPEENIMCSSGIGEINRVLGGGITSGGVVLIGGEPGIGKSTIMMQLAGKLSERGRVLYVSGEESSPQVKLRAKRLDISGPETLSFFFSTGLSLLTETIAKLKPSFIIIDSIQTLFSPEAGSVPGTVSQLKYCCQELIDTVKLSGASLFLVAHVTKEGVIAGPRTIEHMVDTVLYFEHSENEMRILRAVKNRFGSVDELGLFRMTEKGLEEISSPENAFLVPRNGKTPSGVCIAAVHEGSRVFLVEIQALTVPAKSGISRVFSDRIDTPRISRIAAVLEKHTGVRFSDQDIYVNVAGGMRIREVGVDLPAAIALYSARTGLTVPEGMAAAGELSLTGEIRGVPFTAKRAKAAANCGIKKFCTAGNASERDFPEGSCVKAFAVSEAVKSLFKG